MSTDLSLSELREGYAAGTLDPVAVTEAYLDRIARENPRLNAYVAVTAETAREAAEASAARWRAGRPASPIDGAPIAVKDNIDMAGIVTTNGLPGGRRAVADGPVIARLREAGAVLLGKTNLHEAAFGTTTFNPHWGMTHNPHREGWTAGGSSGGSGTAVAAGLAAAALGSDTMGSVRLPAAYCGCFGLKPTQGAVSLEGVAPLAPSLDHVGPLARTAEDALVLLEVMAGRPAGPEGSWHPVRLAAFDRVPLEPDVEDAMPAFDLPALDWPDYDASAARKAGLLVIEAEAFAALGIPDGASDELAGLSRLWREAGARAAGGGARKRYGASGRTPPSASAMPSSSRRSRPCGPFPRSRKAPANQAELLAFANLTGLPALAFPSGRMASGMPFALQAIAGRAGSGAGGGQPGVRQYKKQVGACWIKHCRTNKLPFFPSMPFRNTPGSGRPVRSSEREPTVLRCEPRHSRHPGLAPGTIFRPFRRPGRGRNDIRRGWAPDRGPGQLTAVLEMTGLLLVGIGAAGRQWQFVHEL